MLVSGILQRAGAKNKNGRIYPKPMLKNEVQRYKEQLVEDRRALGAVDHPSDDEVKLKRASHNIVDIWWDGDEVHGKIEVLKTPNGKILQGLFESDINVGISSRGRGDVRKSPDGTIIVEDNFELIAFDFVSNPSTHQAFMSKINESVEAETDPWATVRTKVQEIADTIDLKQ